MSTSCQQGTVSSVTVNGSLNAAELTGLMKFTRYLVTAEARNSQGTVRSNETTVQTSEDGKSRPGVGLVPIVVDWS